VIVAAVLLTVAAGLAALLFRPRRVNLPDRVPPESSVWPVALLCLVLIVLVLLVQTMYLSFLQATLIAREGPEAKLDLKNLSSADVAFLAVAPPAAALIVVPGGLVLVRRASGVRLGLDAGRAVRGVLVGLLASACVVPLVFGSSILVEWLYQRIQYHHPPEHDMLRAMSQAKSNPVLVWVMVVGAAIIVPLCEEIVFRGLVQTVLRRMFTWAAWRLRQRGPRGFPLDDTALPLPSPPALADKPFEASPSPTIRSTWEAIIVTSVLFAIVHPGWTWPLIFLLSVCLGYAYERTGNLWVPVVIHAAFNTTSMLNYFALGGGAA
jgi:membrane protease YdiL (CAAX protease family)